MAVFVKGAAASLTTDGTILQISIFGMNFDVYIEVLNIDLRVRAIGRAPTNDVRQTRGCV